MQQDLPDELPARADVGPAPRARAVALARPVANRLVASVILLACCGVLGLAAWLKPDPRGFGTHQQLGLGPCGMVLMTGLPCPTCGMTTAFAHTVRGRPLQAIYAQPSGFVLALITILAAAVSLWTLLTGRSPMQERGAQGLLLVLTPYRLAAILLLLLFGGWGIKILIGYLDGSLPVGWVKI